MSRNIGEYLADRINVLRNWREIVNIVARVIKQNLPEAELYVFGSILTNRITGSSDIDLLVVIPSNLSEREIYVYLVKQLEEKLGSTSYVIDLHVVRRDQLSKPPYIWWIKDSIKID